MGKPRNFGELEVGYDPRHERREWVVQRVGWSIMALAAIAALTGLLGPGPLSEAAAGSKGGALRAEYQRFGRRQAPAELRLFCRPSREGEFKLSIDRSFFEHVELKDIRPRPKEWASEGDRNTLFFIAKGPGEHLVTLRYESLAFGRQRFRLALDEFQPVTLEQFYWP